MHSGISRRALIGVGLAFTAAVAAACTSAIRSGPPAPSPDVAATGPGSASAALSVPRVNSSPARPRATTTPGTTTASTPGRSTASRPSSRPAAPPTRTSRTAPTSTRPPGGPAEQISHGPTDRGQVALTFHGAGDTGLARQILQIARQKKALITVMAVGTWLAENPEIGPAIVAGGHEMGNHTWSHQDINSLSATDVTAEIVRCRDLLRSQIGSAGRYFRQSQSPTANALVRREAGAAGYATCLSYDLDSMDWTDPGASAIRANVREARAGSIVSMHLGHQGTVDALPGILDDLRSRHLTAVTVSTLLRG
ncbi:Peptidoglycan/xylan/chitin deacetylase, PgdA/CDA1 family [Nakamurella panacisegetis]|uniref:Peptidoglycan/xylan/chitin deacetylase, PgdA/CDA1 family n=1 Tax=Nakamurella panacisegetis TaxID=1090615 RepID=A0A1H0IQ91_9ACTN|nr:polysaccharide deacetylase family protein [Nakamurella panacisegetis]SDO33535.1 Peptidoglycan/xylan/chitin deacetylase, PgdA/CDA1 family [Nakamurella panacisegetis]